MQCDVCHRTASDRLPLYCTLCARNALYNHRTQLAQTLLQKEDSCREVEQRTTNKTKASTITTLRDAKLSEPHSRHSWLVQRAAAEETLSQEKVESTLHHIQLLREEIKEVRDNISTRKVKLNRRRSEFTSAKQELLHSQANAIDPVEKGIRRTEHRWDILHKKTAESRLFLCREAALLYGLQQRKRKKGGLGRDVYFIGGVPIIDLRDLNSRLIFLKR